MNTPQEQLEQIRTMMDKSTRFISLSGLAGVFAGFFALAGAAAFYVYVNKNLNYGYTEFARNAPINISLDFTRFVIVDALLVLIFSIGFAIFFTTKNAKKNGLEIWNNSAKRMLFHLSVPLIAGGIYCIILLRYGWFGMIAPTTLIFYGLALLNASKFTLDEIKWLGISEVVLGLIGCNFIGFGITFWAIGFGVLHIFYGLMMYSKYEAKTSANKYW